VKRHPQTPFFYLFNALNLINRRAMTVFSDDGLYGFSVVLARAHAISRFLLQDGSLIRVQKI